jgi:hypothetical protein
MAHRELALGMIGNMIAEITRGIRAYDVSSRLGHHGQAWLTSSRARCVLGSRCRGVRASPRMGGTAGLHPQPLGDLERDTDFQAVAGQREGEQSFGALEAVEDRVAVGV